MIFLTVGTTRFPFNRLLRAVDKAIMDSGSQEKLMVQGGPSTYQFKYKNIEVFKEIPFDKMITFLKKSRVIISHGGPATIFLALKYGQSNPLIVPRLKKFNEHVDNHQLYFAELLKKEDLAERILEESRLQEGVKNHLLKPKKKKIMKTDSSQKDCLVKKLIDFTEKLDGKN